MKILALIALAIIALPRVAVAAPTVASIDTANSVVQWTGRKVTGSHFGTVKIKEGNAIIESGKLVGGTFEIDMSSISVEDITNPRDNAKLRDHLKSDDFFGSSLFPTTTFSITKAEPIVNAGPGEANYNIFGDLTIKGITNPLSFPAIVTIDGGVATAKASVEVDRTKYNVRYGSGRFFQNLGNRLIYDQFEVSLDLKASSQG